MLCLDDDAESTKDNRGDVIIASAMFLRTRKQHEPFAVAWCKGSDVNESIFARSRVPTRKLKIFGVRLLWTLKNVGIL